MNGVKRAERADYRNDRRYLKDVDASMRRNPLPLYATEPDRARKNYTTAGYGYKRPRREWKTVGNGTAHAVMIVALLLAWIFWMAYTPSGNDFAMRLSKLLFGV